MAEENAQCTYHRPFVNSKSLFSATQVESRELIKFYNAGALSKKNVQKYRKKIEDLPTMYSCLGDFFIILAYCK
jgi:hypothetical protein